MTSNEAKNVLSVYPPEGQAEDDPNFVEALAYVVRDPDLSRWFEESRAFDRALTAKLKEIVPPSGLKSEILSKISGESARVRFRPAQWLALAAVLVFGGLVLVHQIVPPARETPAFSQFKSDTLAMLAVAPAPQLDLLTPRLSDTRQFINERGAPSTDSLPKALKKMETAGCRVFEWRGYPASLTCFQLPSGKFLHLVVIDDRAFGSEPVPLGWQTVNGWHIMLQRQQNRLIMWATRESMEEFKSVMAAQSV
jgi:hypothetical protein